MYTLPRDNRWSLNFKVTSSKLPWFLQKIQLMIVEAGQIFKSHYENYLIFAKVSARDIGQCKFSSDFIKSALFWRKFQLLITGAVQVFEVTS